MCSEILAQHSILSGVIYCFGPRCAYAVIPNILVQKPLGKWFEWLACSPSDLWSDDVFSNSISQSSV